MTLSFASPKVGSNLGPNTDKLGPKPWTMTQHKARRTDQIAFLSLPVTQEVAGPVALTTFSILCRKKLRRLSFLSNIARLQQIRSPSPDHSMQAHFWVSIHN